MEGTKVGEHLSESTYRGNDTCPGELMVFTAGIRNLTFLENKQNEWGVGTCSVCLLRAIPFCFVGLNIMLNDDAATYMSMKLQRGLQAM